MLAEITIRRKLVLVAVLGLTLLMVVYGGAWRWAHRSDLVSLYRSTAAGPLYHVAFSPNSQMVATAAANGTIQLWQAADGSLLRSLTGHVGPVAIAFHPAGTQLVSAGEDGTVRLWQIASDQPHTALWPPTLVKPASTALELVRQIRVGEPFSAVTFSPDGQLIAAGTWYGWVVIFHAATGQVVNVVQAYPEFAERPPQRMEFIAISPDNQWLTTNTLNHLKLWHLPDRRFIQDFGDNQIQNVPFYAQRATFTADNTQMWLFDDGGYQIYTTPLIWSLNRRAFLSAPPGLIPDEEEFTESDKAISIAISIDRQLLAFGSGIRHNNEIPSFLESNDPRIIIWRIGEDSPVYTLRGHSDNITDLAFSPDSYLLASVSLDGTLRLWRIEAS